MANHALEILCMDCKETHIWGECPLKGICLFCKERPATIHFGDMLSLTHGGSENCCDLCCARMQLAHAQERAAAIPELEAKVAKLEKALLPKPEKTKVDAWGRGGANCICGYYGPFRWDCPTHGEMVMG